VFIGDPSFINLLSVSMGSKDVQGLVLSGVEAVSATMADYSYQIFGSRVVVPVDILAKMHTHSRSTMTALYKRSSYICNSDPNCVHKSHMKLSEKWTFSSVLFLYFREMKLDADIHSKECKQ